MRRKIVIFTFDALGELEETVLGQNDDGTPKRVKLPKPLDREVIDLANRLVGQDVIVGIVVEEADLVAQVQDAVQRAGGPSVGQGNNILYKEPKQSWRALVKEFFAANNRAIIKLNLTQKLDHDMRIKHGQKPYPMEKIEEFEYRPQEVLWVCASAAQAKAILKEGLNVYQVDRATLRDDPDCVATAIDNLDQSRKQQQRERRKNILIGTGIGLAATLLIGVATIAVAAAVVSTVATGGLALPAVALTALGFFKAMSIAGSLLVTAMVVFGGTAIGAESGILYNAFKARVRSNKSSTAKCQRRLSASERALLAEVQHEQDHAEQRKDKQPIRLARESTSLFDPILRSRSAGSPRRVPVKVNGSPPPRL